MDIMTKYCTVDDLTQFKNYVVNINIDNFYFVEISRASDLADDDEIIEWIAKNITKKWSDAGLGKYYFEMERDAVACKLRWI